MRFSLLVLATFMSATQAAKNVLWIIADDLKHMEELPGFSLTPVIDKLRARGVEFRNAHSQYTMCGPSRLSFMSGMAPHNIYSSNRDIKFKGMNPALSDGEICLLRDRVKAETGADMLSINQMVKKAGVPTYGYGKIWHGNAGKGTAQCPREKDSVDDRWTVPVDDGIPRCEPNDAHHDGRTCLFSDRMYSSYEFPGESAERSPFPSKPGSGNRFASNTPAVQFVNPPLEKEANIYLDVAHNYRAKRRLRELMQTPENPWFMVVGYQRPHLPFTVPQRILLEEPRLDTVNFRPPALEPTSVLFRRHSPEAGEWQQYAIEPKEFNGKRWDVDVMRRGYYASVRFVDSLLGELIDILDTNPEVRQNTAIILMGDHGFWIGDRTRNKDMESSRDVRNHAGFCKHSTLEGAVRTALIIDAPEIHESVRGTKSDAPVELLDIFPTILDMFGIQDRPPQKLDGTSLMPILTGQKKFVKAFARNGFKARTSFRTKRHRIFVNQNVYGSTDVPKTVKNIVDVVDYVKDPAEEKSIEVDKETMQKFFEELRLDIDPNGKEPFDKDGPFGSYCCDTVERIESHLRPWSFPIPT